MIAVELLGVSLDERTGENGEVGVAVYVELNQNGITKFRIEN